MTWHICMCGVAYPYVWHDSFVCVTWLIHMYDITHSYVWHGFIHLSYVTLKQKQRERVAACCSVLQCVAVWLVHVWMTHSWFIPGADMQRARNLKQNSFICVTWLSHMCDMTHSHAWQNSFICMTWIIHICVITHSCVWLDAFIIYELI